MARCDTSTAIFGRVVTRLDVTLPPFQRDHPLDDPGALLIGLTAGEATRAAEGTGWTLRVMMIDGVGQIGIADREPNRLDLTVEDGIITRRRDRVLRGYCCGSSASISHEPCSS